MQQFSQEHSTLLLDKEWLVKVDNNKSAPYLMKFYSNTAETSCTILMTDTKLVWAEVLSSKDIARRWRSHNRDTSPGPGTTVEEEEKWRISCLVLLSKAHTLGGITDLSFDVVDSIYSDMAFELECDSFKWRWETNFVGYKQSAEIVSRHLVMPLISVNHLAFSSADPVSELSEADLEQAVDKLGRTARRTVDTHVRHAISKPRIATTLRRMTAMFNFSPDPPPIKSVADKPELTPIPITQRPSPQARPRPNSPAASFSDPPRTDAIHRIPSPVHGPPRPATEDSETESDADGDTLQTSNKRKPASSAPHSSQPQKEPKSPVPSSSKPPIEPLPGSDDDSSPPRPTKKAKPPVSSSEDEDSEAERRRRIAQLKQGTRGTAPRQGARQPIKRGGKRF